MCKRTFPGLCVLLLLALVCSSALSGSAVAAQDDDPFSLESPPTATAGPAAAESAQSRSVAGRFLWSTRADGSIEPLGSAIIWLLLLLSFGSIGLITMMFLTNQRKSIVPEAVVAEARQMITAGRYRELLALTENEQSFFSQVVRGALKESSHGFSAMIRALEQTSDELTTIRLRRIEYLNVLGQVSPMIGLFGTVYGMILAFQAIVVAGGNTDPVQLAGGIGTALTTTFWGLVVAIPALAGYAIIRNKIDELTTEATLIAEELCNQFRPRPKQTSSASSSGGGSGGGSGGSGGSSRAPRSGGEGASPRPQP